MPVGAQLWVECRALCCDLCHVMPPVGDETSNFESRRIGRMLIVYVVGHVAYEKRSWGLSTSLGAGRLSRGNVVSVKNAGISSL